MIGVHCNPPDFMSLIQALDFGVLRKMTLFTPWNSNRRCLSSNE